MILSRTDSIGDVVLTLPMAGYLKKYFPSCKIVFLGRTYTREVVALSEHVDEFLNFDELKKAGKRTSVSLLRAIAADVFIHVLPRRDIAILAGSAGIPLRIGTVNRIYHWFTCNKLVRLSRRNSELHESQLNLKLLSFLKIPVDVQLADVQKYYGFRRLPSMPEGLAELAKEDRKRVILHPRSKGSAREWGLINFAKLAELLHSSGYQVFISGTAEDRESMRDFLAAQKNIVDLTGKLSLTEFIAFINSCDALIAASTGPLHIAAALGKTAVGLFSRRRPMHPGRWMPVGSNAHFLVSREHCNCAIDDKCDCIVKIDPLQVLQILENGRFKR